MSIAPAFTPSASATSGAVFGVSSSGVIVATRTRSMSVALRPASVSARRAAATARSVGALVRRGVAALADPGAADDPVGVDADPLGDRAVRDDAIGKLVAEADDPGRARGGELAVGVERRGGWSWSQA